MLFTRQHSGILKSGKISLLKCAYESESCVHQEGQLTPFGVKFTDSHDVLIHKLGEPFATSLMVNVTPLAWEKWRVGDLTIHSMYDRSTMTTRTFSVGPELVPYVKPIPSRA